MVCFTDQNYSFTGTESIRLYCLLNCSRYYSSLEDSYCQTVSIGDITPPEQLESFQVPNTTDQNITLTPTDDNCDAKQ